METDSRQWCEGMPVEFSGVLDRVFQNVAALTWIVEYPGRFRCASLADELGHPWPEMMKTISDLRARGLIEPGLPLVAAPEAEPIVRVRFH